MVSRQHVFEAIQSERDYQVRRWGVRQPDGSFKENEHTVGDFMGYMKYYLDEAFKEGSTKSGTEPALEALRKVITLGVACFEQHGVRPRLVTVLTSVINGHDGKPA